MSEKKPGKNNPEKLIDKRLLEKTVLSLKSIEAVNDFLEKLENLHEIRSEEIRPGFKWRGMKAEDIIDLIQGKKDKLILEAEFPNATTDWYKAISYYNQESKLPLNAALGFDTNRAEFNVKPASAVLDTANLPPSALEYQENNLIINGEVYPEDLRYLVIRFHGNEPGKPGKLECFQYKAPDNNVYKKGALN